jgi:hypothetical protein
LSQAKNELGFRAQHRSFPWRLVCILFESRAALWQAFQ